MATTKPTPATLESIIALWSVQDGLLQQYRVIFVTLQSILISFAGAIYTSSTTVLPAVILAVIAAYGLVLWRTVCRARGEAVYVAQALALKVERGESVFAPVEQLKNFQRTDGQSMDKDKDFLALHGGAHRTRSKLETNLLFLFAGAWVAMGALFVLKALKVALPF